MALPTVRCVARRPASPKAPARAAPHASATDDLRRLRWNPTPGVMHVQFPVRPLGRDLQGSARKGPSEADIDETVREIRKACLRPMSLPVVRTFTSRV